MSNKDEFELDVEETAEDEFDDAALEEAGEEAEEAPAKKKKSGGGLTVFAVLLLLLGGGGFAAVKFLGVELPFNIPGLTAQAEHPAQNETTQMTASADLPAADLPPQPEAPVSGLTQTGSLPIGIDASEQTEADEMAAAAETDPWGVATGTQEAVAVDPFAHAGQQPAETSAVVDPFAFDVADVTAEVAEKGEEALDAAKEVIQDAAKNAKDVAETAAEAVKEEIADPFAALGAPKQEAAPDAQTSAAAPVDAAPAAVQATESSVAPAAEVAPPVPEQSVETVKAVAPKPVEEPKAAKVEEKKQAEPKKAAEPSKEVSKPKEAAKPAAPPARKIDWVLRSAKPGTALVSERGSNEMRTVAVGDTLSGIGKVTAITTDSQGRWVVSGTRGSIKQ